MWTAENRMRYDWSQLRRAEHRGRGAGRARTPGLQGRVDATRHRQRGSRQRWLEDAGLTVIMDRCPKIEYGRFSGEIGWMGINRKVIDNRKPQAVQQGRVTELLTSIPASLIA